MHWLGRTWPQPVDVIETPAIEPLARLIGGGFLWHPEDGGFGPDGILLYGGLTAKIHANPLEAYERGFLLHYDETPKGTE